MTNGKKTTITRKPAASGSSYQATSVAEGEPKVFKKSDGGKRKYSKGTRDFQKVAEGFGRGAEKLADGVKKGFSEYRERSESSADSQKDGMIRDLPVNVAEAFAEAVSTAAKAPAEVAREITYKRVRRLLRRIPLFPF